MSDYIAAKDVLPTDVIVGWERYHVVRFEPNAKHGGRIRLQRNGLTSWFPVDPDETIEIHARADAQTTT